MKKAKQLTTAEIQKEQLFLVHLERELTNVLGKINENLNTLKVEELQLRSNAVSSQNDHEDVKVAEATITKTEEQQPTFNENPELVNQQEIDLDVYLSHFNEEEEEDE